MMRVGITGASGFIGGSLIAELLSNGHEAIGFSRNPRKDIGGCSEIRRFPGEENFDLTGLDALVHLAGSSVLGLWTPGKKKEILESRVKSTEKIVEELFAMDAADRPSVFACASGVGIYGNRGDEWLDEESDAGFGFLAEVTKQWEAAAKKAENFGVRTLHLRIGFVLGPDGGAIPPMQRIFGMGLGGNLGNGKQWVPWIHIDDVSAIILNCLENEVIRGPVNLTSPEPVTNKEFSTGLAKALRKPKLLPVPSLALKMLPGGMHEIFLASQRVEPTVMKSHGYQWLYPRVRPAIEAAL